jgi:hypothetical protein
MRKLRIFLDLDERLQTRHRSYLKHVAGGFLIFQFTA